MNEPSAGTLFKRREAAESVKKILGKGITIVKYTTKHGKLRRLSPYHAPPHFHAKYGGERAAFSIHDLRLIEGKLPPRVVSLVLEWAFQHRDELLENWERAERREDLHKIEPLV